LKADGLGLLGVRAGKAAFWKIEVAAIELLRPGHAKTRRSLRMGGLLSECGGFASVPVLAGVGS
jgi:hypothetical protein